MRIFKKSFFRTYLVISFIICNLFYFVLFSFLQSKAEENLSSKSIESTSSKIITESLKETRVMFWFLGVIIFVLANIFIYKITVSKVDRLKRELDNSSEDNDKKFFSEASEDAVLEPLIDSISDLTFSLKNTIQDISEKEEGLSTIIDNLTEGVIAVDENLTIRTINPFAENIFGCKKEEVKGHRLVEVVKEPKIDEVVQLAIEKSDVIQDEVELFHQERKILRVNALGMPNHGGQIKAIVVFYDITKIRELDKVRNDFVANASHELRTPLTSIRGFVETLIEGAYKDEESALHFLKIIQEDTERLSRLAENLLTLTKSENTKDGIKKEEIDLNAIFKRVLGRFDKRIKEKSIKVNNLLSKEGSCTIFANADQIEQIFINLIDNATKFNKDGGEITANFVSEGNFSGFSISDKGIGIPDSSTSRIFERFFCVDQAHSRELGGSGLGLSIVKNIVGSYNGKISCESSLGKGSTFTCIFPL